MLSDDDKERIRAEEETRVQAREHAHAEQARIRAANAFRARVAAELTDPKRLARRRTVLLAVSSLVAVSVLVVLVMWLSATPSELLSGPSDGTGGITDAALIERCKAEVRARLGDAQAGFPPDADTVDQVSASSDGKRWEGWAIGSLLPGRPRVDFSCRYTPQNDAVELEIIKP